MCTVYYFTCWLSVWRIGRFVSVTLPSREIIISPVVTKDHTALLIQSWGGKVKICTPCIPSINFSKIHACIKCSGFNLVLIVFWWNRGTRACTTALTFAWACSLLICEEFEIIKRGFFSFFLVFSGRGFERSWTLVTQCCALCVQRTNLREENWEI